MIDIAFYAVIWATTRILPVCVIGALVCICWFKHAPNMPDQHSSMDSRHYDYMQWQIKSIKHRRDQ
ncbi:hypothetical protein [Planctomycetes bacterium TBK1r]|uniref:Uncharacterized protein n=1 Tax=Stieleria magnilauensis TaxID=2527963 RepID=A0ABX5XYC8_9BACT|nr:hypothetical protein TBK1r_59970 [Planctomycetes bacterium TBK1r]QDV87048.1 hypothetical protein TBK1r_60750 [Planctomycetes bacterium TBK1r]